MCIRDRFCTAKTDTWSTKGASYFRIMRSISVGADIQLGVFVAKIHQCGAIAWNFGCFGFHFTFIYFTGSTVQRAVSYTHLTRLRKGVIGFVFQSFNLIDELNVFEKVELPLTYLGIRAGERKERVREILKRRSLHISGLSLYSMVSDHPLADWKAGYIGRRTDRLIKKDGEKTWVNLENAVLCY